MRDNARGVTLSPSAALRAGSAKGPERSTAWVPSGAEPALSAREGHPRGDKRWAAILNAIRRIAGMPDYAAHLEHLRRSHPERPVPTQREFYEEFVRNRYEDGPTRCC